MGNTANLALPYPEDTEPLANMAAAIQSLASAMDVLLPAQMKRGTSSITFNASGEGTLTHNLGAVPTAILCNQRAGGAGTALLVVPKAGAAYGSTTATLVARNGASAYTGGALTVDWLAVG